MRKIVNGFILALTAVLVVLPFVIHITVGFGKNSLESERLIVQLVFVFACLAGIITTADKKQLNIEIFTSKFNQKIQNIIYKVLA